MTAKYVVTDDENGSNLTERPHYSVRILTGPKPQWTPDMHFGTVRGICYALMSTPRILEVVIRLQNGHLIEERDDTMVIPVVVKPFPTQEEGN